MLRLIKRHPQKLMPPLRKLLCLGIGLPQKFGAASLPETVDAEQIMRTRGVALSILHRIHVVAWSLLGGLLVLLDRKREFENSPKAPQ